MIWFDNINLRIHLIVIANNNVQFSSDNTVSVWNEYCVQCAFIVFGIHWSSVTEQYLACAILLKWEIGFGVQYKKYLFISLTCVKLWMYCELWLFFYARSICVCIDILSRSNCLILYTYLILIISCSCITIHVVCQSVSWIEVLRKLKIVRIFHKFLWLSSIPLSLKSVIKRNRIFFRISLYILELSYFAVQRNCVIDSNIITNSCKVQAEVNLNFLISFYRIDVFDLMCYSLNE